jgi:hypothetical protein
MAGDSELDSLDSAKYIFLRGLSEPRANSLHLVVQEAVVNPAGLPAFHPELPELAEILKILLRLNPPTLAGLSN